MAIKHVWSVKNDIQQGINKYMNTNTQHCDRQYNYSCCISTAWRYLFSNRQRYEQTNI